jgi:hypothetical protein
MRLRLILPADENANALGIGQRAIGDGDLSGKMQVRCGDLAGGFSLNIGVRCIF